MTKDPGADGTRAKVMVTLGPASSSMEVISQLVEAGVDGFRFNFSHGSHESHRKLFDTARRVIEASGRTVALIQDLQGPKIRVGSLEGGRIELEEGGEVFLTARPLKGSGNRFSVTYPALVSDVRPGETVLLDDGNLRLKVLDRRGEWVRCRVEEGGVLLEHKGVNLPATNTSLPPVTEKDREDLRFGLELGFDYVALSFVQQPDDLELLRSEMDRAGRRIPIIAKIERPAVLQHLEAVISASDMIMVARGDLGIELDVERIPMEQKRIIRTANRLGVPVITATQMLESMIVHQTPTRAETTDVANAVYDGTDVLMLSGETSVGKYPLSAVRMMRRIIALSERFPEGCVPAEPFTAAPAEDVAQTLSYLAARAADRLRLRALWVYTQSGDTARQVSKCRPSVDIFAFCPRPEVIRRMALLWGVRPLPAPLFSVTEECIRYLNRYALDHGLARPGDRVAITIGSPIPKESPTNLLKLHTVSQP